MAIRAPLILAFSCLAMAGCGDDGDDEVGGETPAVEVLDAGDEPRQELTLDVDAGDEVTTTLSFEFSSSGTIDGSPLPAQDIPRYSTEFTTIVDEVTDEEIVTSFSYGDVEVETGGGADPAVVAQLESALSSLEGTGGSLTQTPNGALIDGTIDQAEGLDPAIEGVLSQTNEQLRSLTVPFPEEPVGIGATWEAETSFDIAGVTANQTTTYALAELNGDQYTLRATVEQTLEPGEIGGGGEIIDSNTTGTASLQGSLTSLLPDRSDGTTSVSVTSEVPGPDGETQEVVQEIEIQLTLESE